MPQSSGRGRADGGPRGSRGGRTPSQVKGEAPRRPPPASREQVELNRELMGALSASDVMSIISRSLGSFNLVNCVTALQRLAKSSELDVDRSHGDLNEATLAKLLQRSSELIESEAGTCEPRHLSGALWASARLGRSSPELEGAVAKASSMRAADFKPQEISNAMWAFAKLDDKSQQGDAPRSSLVDALDALVAVAATSIRQAAREWTPQGLSNVCWASATLGLRNESLLDALLEVFQKRSKDLNAQELSNTLWAFAKLKSMENGDISGTNLDKLLGPRSPGLQALVLSLEGTRGTAGRLNDCTCQQLANCVWGCAKLGLAEGPLLAAFGRSIKSMAGQMNIQELTMAAWGMATAGGSSALDAFPALIKASRPQLLRLSARQLSTLVWSSAKLGQWDDEMANVVADRLEAVASEMGPLDLANFAWGFAKMDARSPKALKMLAAEIERQLKAGSGPSFTPQHLTMLTHSLAILGLEHGDPAALELLSEVQGRVAEFNARDITNTTSALAMMGGGSRRQEFLRHLGDQAVAKLDDFNSQELLKFLGAYHATGASHPALDAATSQQRELPYSFPALGASVTLLAGTPRRFRRSEARKRIDNSCHGGGRGNTGVALWEGSYVLSEWLSRQHQPEEAAASCSMLEALGCNGNPLLPAAGETGKQRPLAVELGAGLGLPSIVASNMGFDVVATDGDLSALELLASNIKRNSPKGAVARAEQLVWGSPDPKSALGLRASPDLILAADVVYGNDPKAWQSLLHTIASLANENTLMLLANMQRYPLHHPMSEAAFLEKALEPHFRFAKVPQSLLHPEYQRSGAGSCIIYVFCRRPGAGPLPTTTGAAVTELPSNAANVKLDIKEEHKQPPGRNNGQGGGKENRGSQKRHHRLMLAQGGPMMPLAGSYARLSATMGLLRFGFKAPQSRGQKKRRTLTSTSHR